MPSTPCVHNCWLPYDGDIGRSSWIGANEVILEEFETSVEIFTPVLGKYLIPRDEIEKLTTEVRADGYEMLRSLPKESASFSDLRIYLPDFEISAFRVNQESPLVGKTLAQIELRKKLGVTLLAIRRDSQIISDLGGRHRILRQRRTRSPCTTE
jgi:CPA2 family monovalent cation:H+ antiporter-2